MLSENLNSPLNTVLISITFTEEANTYYTRRSSSSYSLPPKESIKKPLSN